MIDVRNLCYSHEGLTTKKFSLTDISFSLEDGFMMVLLGKNGSGKTTLLKAMYGINMVDAGSVLWDEKVAIEKTKTSEFMNKMEAYHSEVAYVGGEQWCFDNLTVNENSKLLSKLYDSFDIALFDSVMKSFDFPVSDREKKYRKLSTGQKMQFQIAFNIARHPRLIIMDEPLANLDPIVKTDILEIIRNQIKTDNLSVIMSTHLVDEITDMVDYIGLMEDGKLTLFGDRETIFDDKKIDNLRQILTEKED